MGIPSYYKRLVDRFPKLVQKGIRALPRSDVLLMDFNCLIYQCVRGEGVPAYRAEERETWEAALLEAVKRYTVGVWEAAGRPATVFIGVDGVVPMAKIRQQRLRRFKSPWWAAAEREAGVREGESWDTNAITPGTEFMEKLARGLRGLCEARGSGWSVSAADEAGEGEQKLMAWVRARGGTGSTSLAGKEVVVYGLDADLIVLSLLAVARDAGSVGSWKLLRELAEFEGGREGTVGAFGCLDIQELLRILVPSAMPAAEYMTEYACGMSFLGNDFLPHSMTVKMREGGHDTMCRALVELHTAGQRLVRDGRVQVAGCLSLVQAWAEEEEGWMQEACEHKYKMRGPPPRNDKERAMQRVQNLPLEWAEERAICGAGGGLVADWRDIYRTRWLKGAGATQTGAEYMRGLQWIMDYYLGRPVSYAWYFPWNLPPLWRDLVGQFEAAVAAGKGELEAPAPTLPVAPQEQLAMVLPMSSWWLVRDPKLRGLPSRAPVYWPERFGFFSAGKRWMWECEAEIPLLTWARLRALVGPA
jgi:5'-3' exonuclease